MTAPELSDGQPYEGHLIAVLDETSPVAGAGVYYVVTTAIVLEPSAVLDEIDGLFDDPTRKRPFHWHKEGPAARDRILRIIEEVGVVAYSRYQSVGRKRQIASRGELIVALADELVGQGVDHLIIEAGDKRTNTRDRTSLLEHFREDGGVPFHYDWRSKQERLLWLADGINGAIKEFLTGEDVSHLERLMASGVLEEPYYHPHA